MLHIPEFERANPEELMIWGLQERKLKKNTEKVVLREQTEVLLKVFNVSRLTVWLR